MRCTEAHGVGLTKQKDEKMGDITKDIIAQSQGAVTEFYKDAVKPSAQPLGEIIGYLPRTLRVFLNGWGKWLNNREESLRLTSETIKDKVKQIPEEKLVEPEPYVAIPAIQQLCYCQNSDELRDMYANLLTSSMNADKKWQVHPSFVDIIKQLNPDEAKFLKALIPNAIQIYPLIDVDFSFGQGNVGGHPIITNFTDYSLDALEYPQNICSYIDNLVRLNIIEIPFGQRVNDPEKYKSLENHPMIKNPVKGDKVKINYKFRHKMFKLTNFGVNLLQVVCQ